MAGEQLAGELNEIIVVAQADTAGEIEVQGDEAVEGAVTGTEVEHAPEEHGIFPPFDASTYPSQFLWFAITFAALYLFLSRVALPRIGGILESRRARIDGDLKEADRLRVESERALTAYEEALAEARRNAHAIAEETRQGIRTDIAGKRTKVETDLAARMAEAESRITATKTTALATVDEIAADTAIALVAQLAGTVSEADARAAVAAAAAKG